VDPLDTEEVNFQMKRIAHLGFPLLMILAVALPTLAQTPDTDAYRTLYNEKDPAKQAELCEKFLAETGAAFKDSMYREGTYLTMFRNYIVLKNWAKALDAAEKIDQLVPTVKPANKINTYTQAMAVGQQTNNIPKITQFGEKILAMDPNNLNALITLAPILVAQLPEDAAAKDAALNKAMDYSKKALALPKPANVQDAQWQQVQAQLHSTVAFVYLNKLQYAEATGEYEQALKSDPKDGIDQWRLGLGYQGLARSVQPQLVEAYNKENEAKAAKAEQSVQDDLVAKREALLKDFNEKRDKAIDALARAVALGGQVAPLALPTLQALYKNKKESLDGLDDLIAEKKNELGVK
jgi:tetratricopeptide (TPR) repeat protein